MFSEFYHKGFQVFPDILSLSEVERYSNKIEEVYEKQLSEFGDDSLGLIGERNMARALFLYDSGFYNIFYNEFTLSIVRQILGDYAILSLQNGIIVRPNQDHHQSFYHRDIIYQEFVSSRPLSINLFYCLGEFNQDSGGTIFIPESHKREKLGDEEGITPECSPGSVILFDSMVFHKAGINTTKNTRYGVNNMYTLPFIKQQISYPNFLNERPDDRVLSRMLGFESKEFLSVRDFRNYRMSRK